MIAMGVSCNGRRGSGEGDKVNGMTKEAIACGGKKKKNQCAWTMLARTAICP